MKRFHNCWLRRMGTSVPAKGISQSKSAVVDSKPPEGERCGPSCGSHMVPPSTRNIEQISRIKLCYERGGGGKFWETHQIWRFHIHLRRTRLQGIHCFADGVHFVLVVTREEKYSLSALYLAEAIMVWVAVKWGYRSFWAHPDHRGKSIPSTKLGT